MMSINDKCFNTVRIITVVDRTGKVEIVSSILRTGFDKQVDNFDAGGISALIEKATGIVMKPGRIKDPFTEDRFPTHPLFGGRLLSTAIPFWKDVIDLVEKAAKVVPEVRTIGWDVVITKDGPDLLEGNDNWDKTHWELCEEKGFRTRVENWMYENIV